MLYNPCLLLPAAELVSVPHPPQRLQDYGTGLVDILMDSCPTLACTALQGTFNPAKTSDTGPAAAQAQRAPAAPGGGKPWGQHTVSSADEGAHRQESPAKKQRLDGSGRSGAVERRGSVGSVGVGASDVHDREGGRRQSGAGATESAAGSEAGTGDDGGFEGSQGTSGAAAAVKQESNGDAGHVADEDDGGLYDDLPGDGADSRSESLGQDYERPLEGDEGPSQHSDQPEGRSHGEVGDGAYADRQESGDGQYGEDDMEQLDFEDTEFTGMHGDDLDGAVEQGHEGAGDSEDGYYQHSGDSARQQQGSEQDGAIKQEDGEQQQQHEDAAEDEEREDGEYRTDEGDYAEYEEPDQKPDVKVRDWCAVLFMHQSRRHNIAFGLFVEKRQAPQWQIWLPYRRPAKWMPLQGNTWLSWALVQICCCADHMILCCRWRRPQRPR